MKLKFIKATLNDISAIQALAKEIWPKFFSSILSQDQILYMMDMMYGTESINQQVNDGHQYIFINLNDNNIGYCSYELGYKPKIVKLHKIYIHEDNRGLGLGRKTVNHVRDLAASINKNTVELTVNRANESVKAYEKMGFKIVASKDFDIGNNYVMDDYIMHITSKT